MSNGGLSPEHQAIVELILAKGHSREEIAELLGLPVEDVARIAEEAADQVGAGEGALAEEARRAARGEPERDERLRRETIRQTAPVFVLYLLVIVAGIAGAIAIGLARDEDDAAAGETVERFARAFDERDGEAACRELTEGARSALEDQRRRPCERAVLRLEIRGIGVTHVDVAETSAAVDLDEGDRAFLDKTSDGWRISAIGCQPLGSRPYDCELEG